MNKDNDIIHINFKGTTKKGMSYTDVSLKKMIKKLCKEVMIMSEIPKLKVYYNEVYGKDVGGSYIDVLDLKEVNSFLYKYRDNPQSFKRDFPKEYDLFCQSKYDYFNDGLYDLLFKVE